MRIKESVRKYILLSVFVFIVLGILFANILANNQDKQFIIEDALYQQTINLVTEGKYQEASQLINELLYTQQDSHAINYLAGLIAANTGEIEQATIYFQRVLDLNPYRVEEPMFMLQFGDTLYKAGSYQNAKKVLLYCKEAGWAPQEYPNYQEKVLELLNLIENM